MATRRPGWRERARGAWRALRGHSPVAPVGPVPSTERTSTASTPIGGQGAPLTLTASRRTPSDGGHPAPPLTGGRQTTPANYSPFGLSTYSFIWRREYQNLDLATLDIGQYEAGQLLSILADLNPDVGKAVWNILRIAGTSLTFQVTTPSGADDKAGQALVDTLAARLNSAAGGISALLVQTLLMAYLQGAVALEVAATEDLQDVEDFYPVNPVSISFQRDVNQAPVPFQRQTMAWGSGVAPYRRLNTELFAYTPIDPYVDDVYGRPPAAPVLQVVFFQVQVLRDLERVLHAQGWPKIDISVLMDVLMNHVPPDVRQDTAKLNRFVADRMSEIAGSYNTMNPEDAFIHPSYVEVSSEAAKAGSNLFDVAGLLQVIRSQIIAALKQLPALMGEHLGSTETYSTVELTIFTASITAFRQPVGHVFAWAMTQSLQLMGHQAVVTPQWEPIETRDPLLVSKTEAQEAAVAAYLRDQGWITQDQASERITGSKAVANAPAVPMAFPGAPGESTKPATP